VISESSYWKEPLLETAKKLASLKTCGELNENQLAQIERDIFIAFYSVRKLRDSPAKLTDSTKALKAHVTWYSCKEPASWFNSHKIDENFDLGVPQAESRSVVFICGRIIHSFVFLLCLNDRGLSGIYFNSDYDKKSRLFYMDIDDVIGILQRVGSDYPNHINWQADDGAGREALIVR
jgi:hypothetical protein